MPDSFMDKFVIRSKYIPSPSRRRSGQSIVRVKFLVAHDTGNPSSTADQNVRYYINSRDEMSASAHLFVDDKEIIECIPALTAAPEKAWHVLYRVPKDNELYGANANDAAIGVEYCYGGTIDADKAYEKYVWTLAKLCFVFKLDPARDIVGHFFLDPQRKTDPVTGLARSRRTYEQLLRDVIKEYLDCTSTVVNNGFNEIPETKQVTVSVRLNLREEPLRTAPIVQVLQPGTQLTYSARITNGEPVNANPVWFKDNNGNFFWSGGVVTV